MLPRGGSLELSSLSSSGQSETPSPVPVLGIEAELDLVGEFWCVHPEGEDDSRAKAKPAAYPPDLGKHASLRHSVDRKTMYIDRNTHVIDRKREHPGIEGRSPLAMTPV